MKRVPPKAFCVKCFRQTTEYVELEPIARVETFTRTKLNIWGEEGDNSTWVFVKFIDAEGGLLHKLDPAIEPRVGIKVKPVMHQTRVGSILDIKWFTSAD